MALIHCPECGRQVSDRAASCPDCGCPISAVPAAPQVVANNTNKEAENLLMLAQRARKGGDSTTAQKYYDLLLKKDPGNWEAIFFSVYYEASSCKIMNISSAASSLANCVHNSFAAIRELPDEDDQGAALADVCSNAAALALMLASAANSHYQRFSTTNGAFGEFANRVVSAGNIFDKIESGLKRMFPNRTGLLTQYQKSYVTFLNTYPRAYNLDYRTNLTNRLNNEIRQKDPTYVAPATPTTSGSGCCYVATAVYGSYDCPEVWTLRRFRDDTLARTWYGRTFIRLYYAVSPTLVKWFGETKWFKKLWKPTLDKMVRKLNSKGVEFTPYNDRKW